MSFRSSNRGLRRTPAFTLLEIIMVLALFGLVGALIIGSGAAMLRESDESSVEQKTLSTIATIRRDAVQAGEQMDLRYTEKTRLLEWAKGSVTLAGEDKLRLLPPVRASAMLVGGRLVESSISLVRFYPDGTCDPFRVEIVHDRDSRVVTIDPWTCSALDPLPANGQRR